MQKLRKNEIKQAAKIFASAFFMDDLHVYLLPGDGTRLRKLEHLYIFKIKSQLDCTYKTSENMEGVCIWENPNEHHSAITIKDIFNGISLIFTVGIANLIRMIKYQIWSTELRNISTDDRYWYLNVIAVSPEYQGQGFASKMIRPFIEKAKSKNEKVYLETHNKNNIGIYEKYGFKLINLKKIDGSSIMHHCMIC
jgi:ribosomal protein S18 acetylase RimI-like enzyme